MDLSFNEAVARIFEKHGGCPSWQPPPGLCVPAQSVRDACPAETLMCSLEHLLEYGVAPPLTEADHPQPHGWFPFYFDYDAGLVHVFLINLCAGVAGPRHCRVSYVQGRYAEPGQPTRRSLCFLEVRSRFREPALVIPYPSDLRTAGGGGSSSSEEGSSEGSFMDRLFAAEAGQNRPRGLPAPLALEPQTQAATRVASCETCAAFHPGGHKVCETCGTGYCDSCGGLCGVCKTTERACPSCRPNIQLVGINCCQEHFVSYFISRGDIWYCTHCNEAIYAPSAKSPSFARKECLPHMKKEPLEVFRRLALEHPSLAAWGEHLARPRP